MKKIIIATAASMFFIAACNSSSDKDHDMSKMSSNTGDSLNRKMDEGVKEVYKAMETGDVSKLDSFISSDVVDHEGGPTGKEINGRDSLKAMFADMHNHFSSLKMDVISTASNGDYGFSLVKMNATTKDNSMGAPAGTQINSTFVDVVKLKDGKATEHWGFRDPKEMMQMVKNMPPPSGKK